MLKKSLKLEASPLTHASIGDIRMIRLIPRALTAALGLAVLLGAPAQASQLVPQNMKHMIGKADIIVTGEVVRVTDGMQGELPYTEVTLKVKGSFKRKLADGSSYRFRQYGLLKPRKMADGRFLLPAKIEGMPEWTVGEKVTAFLNKPAMRTGLVTPVGLTQGKFTGGGSQLANSFNNQGLFKDMKVDTTHLRPAEAAMLAKPSGAVDTGVLLQFVERAVKEQWIDTGVMR
jgi:hypothetical protein